MLKEKDKFINLSFSFSITLSSLIDIENHYQL